ncbi:phosphonate utilization associated transcriptional regulator [Pseudorhodoferax sp.]|uniref:phosphonate utilization associated transcriptional regulator n=1 Tax=Pseudorhodoferax sp. TaxID=1993553 RepID=UPI0039E4C6B3
MSEATPHSTAIALLQRNSLATLVQAEIEKRILDGSLPAGGKLTEAAIAERLGVSRGPVREAFRMLDEAGLVQTEKNRGVFVRSVSLQEALEIFELRALLEQHVGAKAAEVATPADVRALKALLRDMAQAARDGDMDAYHRLNLGFHDRLFALAGNRKLTDTYQRLVKELSLFRRQNLSAESMRRYTAEHRDIVKHIAAGDAQAAGQAMYRHVMGSRERTLENYRRQHGEPGPAAASVPPPQS